MKNGELVERLHRKSGEWMRKVAYNILNDNDKVDDVIQDVYIYILEMENIDKIVYGDELNLYYVYKTIRSKALNSLKGNGTCELDTNHNNPDEEYDDGFDEKYSIVMDIMENQCHWFNRRLLEVYLNEDHSITSLSQATGISRSTIWNTLTATKKYIKEEYEKKI